MRAVATIVVLVLVLATQAQAGVREALEAYDKGDYAGTLAACRAAAEQGDASCENVLGVLYWEGRGVPKNDAEAARWFRKAAEQGHGQACVNLGHAYELGRGVKQSNEEAATWYGKAAARHVPEGELALGVLIAAVDRSYKEAIKWIRRAARQGLPNAEAVLGLSYEGGLGVKRNDRLALKWYLLGANHGAALAQVSLARLYEQGTLVERDLPEAYFWYAVASKNPAMPEKSRKTAEDGLKRVTAQLTRPQLADADDAVRRFRPGEAASIRGSPKREAQTSGAGPRLHATGSGFVVTTAGHVLSNNHVVAGCAELRVTEGDHSTPAKVLATDPDLDLALVQLPHSAPAAVAFRDGPARLGESVVVMGFPFSGLLTSDAVVTTGIVSALAGMRDDRHQLQISAPVQPGNSGGPLLDAGGHVMGVVVAKLNGVRIAALTGAIPENINFAIKAEEAKAFLKAHGVAVASAPMGHELTTAAIADQGLKYTVRLECWK